MLRRASVFQASVSDVGALIDGVNSDQFIKGFVITKEDVKAVADKRDVEMTALKNGIEKGTRKGYGVIVIANDGQLFCNTAAELAKIFPDLSHDLMTTRDFEKIDPPKLQTADVDTDTAFISIKKDRCRAVFGNADSLRTLMVGLDRDHVPYSLDGRWISSDTIRPTCRESRNKSETPPAGRSRSQATCRGRHRIDGASRRGDWKGQSRQARDAASGERTASSLAQGPVSERHRNVCPCHGDGIESTRLGRLYPDLATAIGGRLTEGWEYVSSSVDVRDYGTTKWKGRLLDAFVVTSTIDIRHRSMGEYKHLCYIAAYINDVEFGMLRSPFFAPCDDGNSDLKSWKASFDFVSKWNAD